MIIDELILGAYVSPIKKNEILRVTPVNATAISFGISLRAIFRCFTAKGKIITAAGVSAGIDMALYLARLIEGEEHAQMIQLVT